MAHYVVDQEKFYGPLDLLLYLVEKDQLDVTEISLAALADQFVRYLEELEWTLEWDEITDFLIMATVLLRLKARLLLPSQPKTPDGEEVDAEEIDIESRLIERILRYKRFKNAAQALAALETSFSERRYFRPFTEKPEAALSDRPSHLYAAMLRMRNHQAMVYQFTLPLTEVKVEQKMQQIMRFLKGREADSSFAELVTSLSQGPAEIAGMFLGMLELTREQKIRLYQAGYLEDIVISPLRSPGQP